MKRKLGECQTPFRVSHVIESLWQIRENDLITHAFVCSLQRLLDADKILIELLTSDNAIRSLSSISSMALSALLVTLMNIMTGHGEHYDSSTNVPLSFQEETVSPSPMTLTSILNNSLSVLNFVRKILCLRYNLDKYTSDVLQLWQSGSHMNMSNDNGYRHTYKHQIWIPRITFMLAYSCLLRRIKIVNKSFKSRVKLNKSETLCALKKDEVIASSISLLSYSIMISRMDNANKQNDTMKDFQKHINHVNDFVNSIEVASEPNCCDDCEMKRNASQSKSTFETLCEEVQKCNDLEDTINELNESDQKLSVHHDSECEVVKNQIEAEGHETDVSVYENAATDLLLVLAEIPTTAREVDFATSKLTSILHEAGILDGVEGIRKVATIFSGKENSVKYSDELLSSLCKSCITEEMSAIRAMVIMESFVLPSILQIGGNDASGPPSRLLATTVSRLLKLRPLETVTSLFVPAIYQNKDENDSLPNKMQLDFINRTIKSIQLSPESANTLLYPLVSMIWSEESIILLNTVLLKVSDDKLSSNIKSKLMDKIILTSKEAMYVKSAKFASLFQTFVKRYGSTLLQSDVQSLLEACGNLKSMTSKSISTSLRKLVV